VSLSPAPITSLLDFSRQVQQQEQRSCGTMELERARSRSSTERGQVQQLLADLGKARTDDHEAERDATYPAQPLAQQGVDDAVAAGLRDRLAALDRALQRVEDGATVARSVLLAAAPTFPCAKALLA
jgi:DnaK suppressor protein